MWQVSFFSSHQWPWGGGGCCNRTQERIRDWGGPLQMLRLRSPVDWQVEPSQSVNCQKVILHSEFMYRDGRAAAAKKWSSIQSVCTDAILIDLQSRYYHSSRSLNCLSFMCFDIRSNWADHGFYLWSLMMWLLITQLMFSSSVFLLIKAVRSFSDWTPCCPHVAVMFMSCSHNNTGSLVSCLLYATSL